MHNELTPSWESDLGKSPDRVIAEQSGIPQATVRARRKELGIPAFQQAPPGQAEVEQPARRSSSVVLRRRQGETARTERHEPVEEVAAPVEAMPVVTEPKPAQAKRAPSSTPLRRRSKMDPYIALIGVRPDAEVARLAGVTPDNVRNFRKRQGIAGAPKGPVVSVPKETTPGVIDAEPVGLTPARKKPGRPTPIDAFAHLLGTVPDAEVARQAGASVAAVTQYRQRRKIAPYNTRVARKERAPVEAPPAVVGPAASAPSVDALVAPPRKKPGKPSPIDAFAHLVGAIPDGELAERCGASVEAVRLYRTYRKIPPFRAPVEAAVVERAVVEPAPVVPAVEPVAVPAVEPVATQAIATSPLALAYKVLATSPTERRKFLVVADGILEATKVAVRALGARGDGPWLVRKIRLMGEGLRYGVQ